MKTVLFYTTSGCHLCEKARELSQPYLDYYGYMLEEVEISESDALMERYGIRIPVLGRPDNDTELGWPYEPDQLAEFLVYD
jgi:hypothetical protein